MPTKSYQFVELGDVSCAEIVRAYPQLVLGFLAVNTSWDSGLLSREDWPSINGYVYSPPVTSAMIQDWPISHDDFCDEWWIFESVVPPNFEVEAFCNYVSNRIGDYKKLDFDGGCRLDSYLEQFQPVAMFGSNDFGYLVQRA
jgi:hypothetical protein